MTTSYNLLERINAKKREKLVPQIPSTGVLVRTEVQWGGRLVPVRLSPFLRRLAEKRLPVKALYNGAFVPDGDGGAA